MKTNAAPEPKKLAGPEDVFPPEYKKLRKHAAGLTTRIPVVFELGQTRWPEADAVEGLKEFEIGIGMFAQARRLEHWRTPMKIRFAEPGEPHEAKDNGNGTYTISIAPGVGRNDVVNALASLLL